VAVWGVFWVCPRTEFGERLGEPDGQPDRLTHLDIVLPFLDDVETLAALLRREVVVPDAGTVIRESASG